MHVCLLSISIITHFLFQGKPQDLRHASSAPKISPKQIKTLTRVCPHLQTADQIFNISRCSDLFKLSPTVSWQDKALKLKRVHLVLDPDIVEVVCSKLRTGQFIYYEGMLLVRCAGCTVLGVSRVVLPFKDVQTAHHFHRDQCHDRTRNMFQMLYEPSDVFYSEVNSSGVNRESNKEVTFVKHRTVGR